MGDPPAALAAALRDRYVLEREFGRGGMATVFLARDVKHDRPVALKVLLPELAASLPGDGSPARPDKALDQLEPLLKAPYFLSPGWLRIDPNFAPLRGNPHFQKLAGN